MSVYPIAIDPKGKGKVFYKNLQKCQYLNNLTFVLRIFTAMTLVIFVFVSGLFGGDRKWCYLVKLKI